MIKKRLPPLTDKQKFALRAVEKGAVVRSTKKIGWQTIFTYFAWDSDISSQIRSLLKRRMIQFSRDGKALELRRENP